MRERNFPCFLPLLVVGGNDEKRKAKAEELIGQSLPTAEKSPDFLLLPSTAGAAGIGIEEVRGLQRFLALKPFREKRKVVLIWEAQGLTPEAQNALLKTLEEPPAHSLLILAAPEASLLLPTIVSRCSLVQLVPAPQVTLSAQQTADQKRLLEELLSAEVGERFILLEKEGIFKDRESSLNWLNELTVVAREQLLADAKGEEKSRLLALLKAINRTKKYLLANCNVRLSMEVFLSEI
jgi:DNA polymerase III gamma/tau subunit